MTGHSGISIDIWSDIMCPWCYVGWGNLRQALETLRDEIDADIHWHAFELNPQMSAAGEERTAHLSKKYGRTMDEARAIQGRMREAAQTAGVSLDYAGTDGDDAPPAMMWNTFDAHKLLHWAGQTHGGARQTDLKIALFKAHFNDRRRIGERKVLLGIAAEQGFAENDALAALDSDKIATEVRADQRAAMDMNITGVPAVVVNRAFIIPGAQAPETYVDALRKIAAKAVT